MREIKFRAWDLKAEQMNEVLGLSFQSQEAVLKKGMTKMRARPLGEVELMQFTGLKDKNGVEIYEGDVVEVEDGPNKKKREVVFHKSTASFTLKLGNGSTEYLPSYVQHGQLEIIGNIYENPNLLS